MMLSICIKKRAPHPIEITLYHQYLIGWDAPELDNICMWQTLSLHSFALNVVVCINLY